MKYCKHCGAELLEGAKFCTRCGQSVDPEEEQLTQENEAGEERSLSEQDEPATTESSGETPPAFIPPKEQELQTPADQEYTAVPTQTPAQQADQGYGAAPPPQVPLQQAGQGHATPPAQQSGYGYTTPPVQQQPQGYGYSTSPPQQNYAYASPPPPVKNKRKRGGLIAIISIVVVLAILAGSYFIFGAQIKQLFMSTEKKWQSAELDAAIFAEDTPLYAIRASTEEFLKQTKFGYATDLTLDLKTDAIDEELAGVMTALSGLRFRLENKIDLDETNPRFNTQLGIGKRGESGNILSAELYDTADYFVISLPEIFPKPLAMSKDFMAETMEYESGLDVALDGVFTGMGKIREDLRVFTSETMDTISEDIKEIFFEYAAEPKLVKGELLTVGNVSQKLNYYEVTVPADDFPAMAKDILVYLLESQELKLMINAIDRSMEFAEGSSAYQEFVEEVNEMLADINADPEEFQVEVHRILYVDAKNNPVGGKLSLRKLDQADEYELNMVSLHAEDNGRHAQLIKFEASDEVGLEYLSHYTRENDLYTGEYKISSMEIDWDTGMATGYTEVLRGTFANFVLKNEGKDLYPLGTFTAQSRSIDEYGDPGMPETVSFKYQGKLDSQEGVDHLIGTMEIYVEDEYMPLTMILGFDHHAIPDKNLTFHDEMVSDFVDISDEYALMELMEDETTMTKLFETLAQLGINIDEFMLD
ncbi:MAG: zinc-ribbon domain-containing protein [Fastidiosipila sp.]|nr:zinc-ribbon domain-containing protein [Fastidiosipila sp.]